MKMKVLVIFLALTVFAAASAQAERVLKFGHIAPTQIENKDFPMHKAALAFAAHVEKETGGEIKIEVFPWASSATNVPCWSRSSSVRLT